MSVDKQPFLFFNSLTDIQKMVHDVTTCYMVGVKLKSSLITSDLPRLHSPLTARRLPPSPGSTFFLFFSFFIHLTFRQFV